MNILLALFNKILVTLFFVACLNTIRHLYYLIGSSINSTPEEPRKYILSEKSLVLLAISIGYILSVLFTGIQI